MEVKLHAPELFKAQTYSGPKYSLSENEKEAVAHHKPKRNHATATSPWACNGDDASQ